MMGDNTTAPTSTSAPSQDQISFLFAAGPPLLSSSSSSAAANQEINSQHQQQQQMNQDPFSSSSYYHHHHHHPLERSSGGEDSGAGSEEGLDVPEEPAKPAPHRSGSKRSRAAEVHNLSEKRRRSRINEKMKALQNLIPNSNKTDKASMLDEAIEYLKQLQLQVQMLSMRNGMTSHPMYLPGPVHPLQASQLCMSFGDNSLAMNLGVLGMVPPIQDASTNNSFDITSQCTTSHQTVMLPTASISAPETSFVLEPSQSHHASSFQLRVPSEEIFTQDLVSQEQLDSGRTTRNLSDNALKTMDMSRLCFGGQSVSSVECSDHLENVLSKDHADGSPIFDQNFDGLQTGTSFTKEDVKSEGLDIR